MRYPVPAEAQERSLGELHPEDLEVGQVALFAPEEPTTTYREAVIDHGPVRTCSECGRPQPLSEFCKRSNSSDGINYRCNTCHRGHSRRARGVAREVSHLRPAPDDRCAICTGDGGARGLFLDHDHATGAFRGWLCGRCNSGIGFLRDHPELLIAATRYLERRLPVSDRMEQLRAGHPLSEDEVA